MNEKEADRVVSRYVPTCQGIVDRDEWKVAFACGYLEAIGRAKVLERALKKVIPPLNGCLEADIMKDALDKWRAVK